MTTVQITLDDETFARLKSIASGTHTSVEQAVEQAVREMVLEADRFVDLDAAADEMLAKYAPVFHRLAQ